jgi:RNA polymerase sigma-70 factor (ECF subfamily)
MKTVRQPDLASLPAALAADLDRAFPDLVRALQDDVFSGALRLTGNRADAEEVTQEAFVRAYRALSGYPAERILGLRVRGWVWTIAANLCRNLHRSHRRRPQAPLEAASPPPDSDPGPEQQALGTLERDRLAAYLAELPWPMRAAVVLRHVVGLGYREIAAALERPTGTVKADVHRGLERLRTALEASP